MIVRPLLLTGALASALLLAACAPATRITLLPQANGQPSAVQVTAKAGTQTLDSAYRSASVSDAGRVQATQSSANEVQRRYGELLALQPPPVEVLMLTFRTGGSSLTSDSQERLDEIMSRALARAGGEIVVVGHTDTVGDQASNDALSLQRAEAIRMQLIQRGFPAERVRAEGRGLRLLLVPTGPNVDEPRNRRAEIIIR